MGVGWVPQGMLRSGGAWWRRKGVEGSHVAPCEGSPSHHRVAPPLHADLNLAALVDLANLAALADLATQSDETDATALGRVGAASDDC